MLADIATDPEDQLGHDHVNKNRNFWNRNELGFSGKSKNEMCGGSAKRSLIQRVTEQSGMKTLLTLYILVPLEMFWANAYVAQGWIFTFLGRLFFISCTVCKRASCRSTMLEQYASNGSQLECL